MNPVETQRHSALQVANEVRSRRGRLKQHMAEGKPTLSEILRADKVWLHSMQLRHLLLAVPGIGPAKVRRALDANRIGPGVTLENFSMRRREELLCWLSSHHPKVGGKL